MGSSQTQNKGERVRGGKYRRFIIRWPGAFTAIHYRSVPSADAQTSWLEVPLSSSELTLSPFYAFMLFLAAGRLKRGVISLARSPNKVRAVQFRLTWMRHQKKAYKRSASFRPTRPDAWAYRGGPRVQIDPIVHDCCSSTHGAASKSCWWRSGGCLRALAFLLVQVPQDAKTRFKTIFFSDKQEYDVVEGAGGGK